MLYIIHHIRCLSIYIYTHVTLLNGTTLHASHIMICYSFKLSCLRSASSLVPLPGVFPLFNYLLIFYYYHVLSNFLCQIFWDKCVFFFFRQPYGMWCWVSLIFTLSNVCWRLSWSKLNYCLVWCCYVIKRCLNFWTSVFFKGII
jgi:hypothetical protein